MLKTSRYKLAFIVLLVATIVWAIIFYYTLQGYREYCEWFDEQPWSEWALRHPWWSWNGGFYVFVAGMFLSYAWAIFAWNVIVYKVYPYVRSRFKAANS